MSVSLRDLIPLPPEGMNPSRVGKLKGEAVIAGAQRLRLLHELAELLSSALSKRLQHRLLDARHALALLHHSGGVVASHCADFSALASA